MSRGLVTSTTVAPMRMNTIAQAVSEKMWYSGSAAIAPSFLVARGDPRADLLHVGDHVRVGQHRALGDAGGAAGVLQEGDVVVPDRHGGQGMHLASVNASRKRTAPSMR